MKYKFTQLSDRVFTGLLLAIIAGLLALSGALIRFDNFYYDLGRCFSFKSAPDDIVIVAVDEASLNSIGSWPWPRSLHAELLKKLSAERPRVIGLDIVFSEAETTSAYIDQVLAGAIGGAKNVVMPILLEVPYMGGPIKQSLPVPSMASQAAALGRIHVPLDADGIARSIYLWEGLSTDGISATGLPHFAQSVLQVAGLLPESMQVSPPVMKVSAPIVLSDGSYVTGRLIVHQQRKINFLGPPGYFQHISYAKVLAGEYPADFFKNKIVLVGITAVGLGDALPTSVSSASQPMSGVEFHANAIVAMQKNHLVTDAPVWFTSLFCILLAIVPLLWLHKLSPQKSLRFLLIYFFSVMVLMVSFPYLLHIWIPPSAALVAIVLAYPIWGWRKFSAAQVILDRELQNLRDELALLGMEPEDAPGYARKDQLQSRILKVKLTAKHLRDMHRGRSDTLAFISHDIRAPLGAAMMLLSEFEENKHADRMKRMLGRAYSMAEGFLQASRAEMANVNKFHGLDMVSIVQQAVDDIYEIAVAKRLKIITIFPDDGLWIVGDFGLLLRAISNILINAVNYSPDGAAIKVELTHDHKFISLEIVDQGPGIPAAKVSKLFRRFSRVDAEHQSREGSGLGLYFVNVTIKKHRGSVSVKSQQGEGSTFIISLPLERRKRRKYVENDRRVAPKSVFNDTI